MTYVSPLRYPGGKGRLAPYLARVLANQPYVIDSYCEPYAGGAGAGLHLLVNGYVNHLIINDLNPGVAAFWRCVVNHPRELLERINSCDVTVTEWHKQRHIYLSPDGRADIDIGFATFFLNRSNRSGILSARPIGGLDQAGKWKIDARFNRDDLSERITLLSGYGDKIDVRQQRAINLIRQINRRKRPILLYVDPPYVVQGEELYMSSHTWSEHQELARHLAKSPHPWLLTYDVDPRTRELYRDFRCLQFGISHTAQVQKVGREYMFFSRGMRVPDRAVLGTEGEWISPSLTG